MNAGKWTKERTLADLDESIRSLEEELSWMRPTGVNPVGIRDREAELNRKREMRRLVEEKG